MSIATSYGEGLWSGDSSKIFGLLQNQCNSVTIAVCGEMHADEDDIIREVRRLMRNGRLQFHGHALYQMRERGIVRAEVRFVLEQSGAHRPQRDRWDDYRQTTAYAIEGPTEDYRYLRIVVCILPDSPIPEELLLVITAIDISGRGSG